MYRSVHLAISFLSSSLALYLSIYLPIYISIYLPIYSIFPSLPDDVFVNQSLFLYCCAYHSLSVWSAVDLSAAAALWGAIYLIYSFLCLYTYLSTNLSVYLSVYWSIHLSAYWPISLNLCLCLCISPYVCISLYICLSIFRSVCYC